jgi:mycofactocin system glycosyltransferase
MIDRAPLTTGPDIRVMVRGYLVDPALMIVPDPRGTVIARDGSRRAAVVNRAAGDAFRRLAPNGTLAGAVPARLPPAEATLMRLLVSRGLAVAQMALAEPIPTVSVIVPTFGRIDGVRRCLRALRALEYPADHLEIVVVDDAHPDHGDQVAFEAAVVGARLIRREVNGGPAASRNTGAAHASGTILGFIDSDCVPPPDWLTALLPEFSDRGIWAVAARVTGIVDLSAIGRYEAVRSPLDMGPLAHDLDAADDHFFVPAANLLIRPDALRRLGGFDAAMRVGEDVDLCLRAVAGGGRIRYVTSVSVGHERRPTFAAFARQRVDYASSEARLVARHPALTRQIPVSVVPTSAALVLAASPIVPSRALRVALALGLLGGQMLAWRRWSARTWPVPAARPRWSSSIRSTSMANATLVDGLVRGFARHQIVPVSLLVGLLRPRRTIGTAALLLVWAAVSDLVRLRPVLDPVRFVAIHALDDLAYNTGLIVGAVREWSLRAYLGNVRVSTGLPRAPRTPTSGIDGR